MACSEQQLALWYQYNFAEKAVAEANTLQAQLGHPASDSQIAAALSCPMPFSLSQCLAIGKVCLLPSLGLRQWYMRFTPNFSYDVALLPAVAAAACTLHACSKVLKLQLHAVFFMNLSATASFQQRVVCDVERQATAGGRQYGSCLQGCASV